MEIIWLALFACATAMLMDMAPENPYSTSCAGVISAMYAFGGSECLSLKSWDRGPCQCKLPDYVETVVSCIDAQMLTVAEADRNSTRLMAYGMLISSGCPGQNLTMEGLEAFHKNSSALPAYDAANRKNKHGPWPVDGAFQVSDAESLRALESFHLNNASEPRSKRFGSALLAYWAGILLLRFLSVCSARVFHPLRASQSHKQPMLWWRKYVAMPPMFGAKSYNRWGFVIPTRAHSLAVFGFVVMVVTFTFAHLPYKAGNYNWNYDNRQTYSTYLGQRSGVLALYLPPLMIFFAGRNNFLQWFTAWPQDVFLIYHRWIGRAVAWEVLIHTIAYCIQRSAAGRMHEMWTKAYWSWGIVGTTFGLFTVVGGIALFRRYSYEIFLVLHIIAAIFFIVGGYYHIDLLDEPIGLKFFYAMFAAWAFDRAARLARVLTSNPLAKAKVALEGDTLELIMDIPWTWKPQMRPGVYVFVHIMTPALFLQSHPFTLIQSIDEPNKVKLFCKVRDGMTRHLARLVQESASEYEIRVLLDGPYGHSHDLSEFDECVFVAGGVGITAPFAYIQNILMKYPRGFQRITLLWAMRDDVPLQWFNSELEFLSEYSRVKVRLFIPGSGEEHPEKARRLDVHSEVHKYISASRGPISVLCCGPASMCNDARNAVATGLDLTTNFVEYFEESFTF